MAELKDSGNRREFATGAVRDMQEGKGRLDLIPWGIALRIRETMTDLFYTRHYGYEVRNGKYHAVSAGQCIAPITQYAEWMDKELNDPIRMGENHMSPTGRLQEIENTFVKMASAFIMFQQVTPDPLNGQHVFSREAFDIENDTAIAMLMNDEWANAMLEVAKHYEDGARKYAENNWRKGMDPKIYFDSAMRHFMKWCRRMKDEPHDRAFIWNCMCGAWEARQERQKIAYDEATKSVNVNIPNPSIPDPAFSDSMSTCQSPATWTEKQVELGKAFKDAGLL